MRVVFAIGLALVPARAFADEPTKQECALAAGRGQVLRDEGKLVSADEVLGACAVDACPAVVREACARWQADVRARMPKLRARLVDERGADVTDARVTVDGAENPRVAKESVAVDPGFHSIEMTARGQKIVENVTLGEREEKTVTLRLAAPIAVAPPPVLPPQRDSAPERRGPVVPAAAWIAGGVSLVALGGFVGFGIQAQKDIDFLKSTCAPYCAERDRDAAHDRALVADVSLATSVVAATVAAVTVVLANRSAPRHSTASSSLRVSRRP